MQTNQDVFKRYEKKYLIDAREAAALRARLGERVLGDAYGRHAVCSLYYDTEDYRLIRASIEKPVYKEKLRLRSYGVPGEGDRVYVEIKKKLKGIVYKRRVATPLRDAEAWLAGGEPPVPCQIAREIDYCMGLYRPFPRAAISCMRTALLGADDPSLRITFDETVRYRDHTLSLSAGTGGALLLSPGQIIMEIKFPGAMPLWLSRILSELSIFPAPFSKYGMSYKRFVLGQTGGRKSA